MIKNKPKKITEQNWPDETLPCVSICCIAYNHEKYISDAIEGFLNQETTFPVEILIHDDASTDNTAEVIKEYAVKYPSIIKPIYQKYNQYVKGIKPNEEFNYPRAKGKYIALCDGDDYWVDKNKLQIQVDYLEDHPEIVVSGHDAYIINEDGEKIADSKLPDKYKRDMTPEEVILIKASVLSVSMVFRNNHIYNIPEMSRVIGVDTFMLSMLGGYGGSHYHKEIEPACWRVHSGGVWGSESKEERNMQLFITWYWLNRYYNRLGKEKYAKRFRDRYRVLIIDTFTTKELIKIIWRRVKKIITK